MTHEFGWNGSHDMTQPKLPIAEQEIFLQRYKPLLDRIKTRTRLETDDSVKPELIKKISIEKQNTQKLLTQFDSKMKQVGQKINMDYNTEPEITSHTIEHKQAFLNDESKYNEQIKLLLEHFKEISKKKERIVYKFNIKSDNNHRNKIKQVLSEFKVYKGTDGPELVYKIEHLEGLLNIMLDILSPKP
jgi:chromosome condensin MukBEF ATPase and DNA-binding subunit MukB